MYLPTSVYNLLHEIRNLAMSLLYAKFPVFRYITFYVRVSVSFPNGIIFLFESICQLNIYCLRIIVIVIVKVVSFILAELSRGIFRSSEIFCNNLYQELLHPSIAFEHSSASWNNVFPSRFSR